MNTAMTPDQTGAIFHNYMDYWTDAPESLVKDNTLAMLWAWAADRERMEGLEAQLMHARQMLADVVNGDDIISEAAVFLYSHDAGGQP
jgi:hypothetical protein